MGERCPACGRGRLYRLPPGVEMRLDGNALLSAVRYELEKLRCSACGQIFRPSNSQFEFLGGVEREVAVETLEHEGEEMRPTGKTQIARQRPQIIKEGLAAH